MPAGKFTHTEENQINWKFHGMAVKNPFTEIKG